MKRIGIAAFLVLQLAAQNAVLRQGSSPSGDVDFSNANTTRPVRTGGTLPGACATNELFFLTNVGLHQCVKGKFAPLGNGGTWGTVGGAIAAQTDLWNTLQTKQPLLNGTQAQYVRGDGSFSSLAPSATTDTTIASNITQGTLPPAVLPNPTTSTIGGLYAAQATAHQWLSYVDANGQQHFARPDASDLTATAPGGVQRTQADKNAETVSVKDFGAKCDGTSSAGTDNATAVLAAIAAAQAGGTVLFPSFGCGTYGYTVGPLGTVTKPVTLDFGGSFIYPKANNAPWLTLGYSTPNGHMALQNGIFSPFAGYVPTDVVVVDGASNASFDHVVFGYLNASHAIIWHKAAYGVTLRSVQFNSNSAPSTLYYSYQLSNPGSYYTLDAKIRDSDFSGVATGRCIGIEGGSLKITDTVIESCAGGGLEHIGDSAPWGQTMNLTNLSIDGVHFEHNEMFNLKFPAAVSPNYFQSNVHATNSVFVSTGGANVIDLGGVTNVTMSGNWIDSGCISGNPSSLHGTLSAYNNAVQTITGTCDPNSKGLIDSSISSILARQGSFHSQLWNDVMGFSVVSPYAMQQLSSTAGSKIVSFLDNTSTERAYVTREGNFYGNFFGPLTGNVTGNVTGALTGNVTGNLTGQVTLPNNTPLQINNAASGTTNSLYLDGANNLKLIAGPGGYVYAAPDSGNEGWILQIAPSGITSFAGMVSSTKSMTATGGFQHNAGGVGKSPCVAGLRSLFWVDQGASGVADHPYLCNKNSSDAYVWLQYAQFPTAGVSGNGVKWNSDNTLGDLGYVPVPAGDVNAAGTVTKVNGVSLAGLSAGILKNTAGTGVPTIAVAGTDYQAPLGYTAENVAHKGVASGYASLDSAAHLPAAQMPALTGDVTSTAGSLAPSVVKVNGAAVPVSSPTIGTNASGQLVAGAAQILGAYCGGVISSNATINLFGDVGHPASGSAACTNSAAGAAGVPLRAGTIKNLRVRNLLVSNTTGSGVVTVWKNNVQQTMTCTLGTSTACSDLVDSFTVADGDSVGIRVQSTAASGDTLGNIFASVQLF